MFRIIDKYIADWKTASDRQILLLRGARQVGKTFSARILGKTFQHFLEVNFEEQRDLHSFFDQNLDPHKINEKLSAYFDIPIIAGKTLLFFDEIQACPKAIQALRFYYEKIPQLHVMAAGSLLEFALEQIPSFGVGRIASLFLYPLSFAEFLQAISASSLYQYSLKANPRHPLDPTFHQQLLEHYKVYQLIGGMPAVVQTYLNTHDLRKCQLVLDKLVTGFEDDFAKYKKRSPISKISETFRSIALQSGEKFKYSKISNVDSHYFYKEALYLLTRAGIAYPVYHTSARGIPLGAQIDAKKFKVILLDSGVHQRMLGLDLSQQLILPIPELINKGALAEVFTGLELLKSQSPLSPPQLYYWHREAKSSNAEVDYIIQKGEKIVPIEVKASTKGAMKSLHLFLEERKLSVGVRVSHENFSQYKEVYNIPIYAVETIPKHF